MRGLLIPKKGSCRVRLEKLGLGLGCIVEAQKQSVIAGVTRLMLAVCLHSETNKFVSNRVPTMTTMTKMTTTVTTTSFQDVTFNHIEHILPFCWVPFLLKARPFDPEVETLCAVRSLLKWPSRCNHVISVVHQRLGMQSSGGRLSVCLCVCVCHC